MAILMRGAAVAVAFALTLFAFATNQQNVMNGIAKENWGTGPAGEQIELYTLRNAKGMEAAITNYGGRLVTLKTPDRRGNIEDVVLGFDDLKGYLGKNPFFGALVGRYANRIADGEFKLDGKVYHLARNNGPNALHGGIKGFDKVVWHAKELATGEGSALELKYLSKDGEEGYPGNLKVTVTYTLTNENALRLDYQATTDKDTVLNLTNHSYFDLSGHFTGQILKDEVTIKADKFTPVNANLIPTGELRSVEGTAFDFRKPVAIGARIDENDEQLKYAMGYDHNFVVTRSGEGPSLAARVRDPESGRVLEVFTTQPGIQFYTGNHLDGSVKGKGGKAAVFRSAFCLETQHYPNSPNQPNFPTTELKPGQRYRETTIFRFSVD